MTFVLTEAEVTTLRRLLAYTTQPQAKQELRSFLYWLTDDSVADELKRRDLAELA